MFDVGMMRYIDRDGKKCEGAHWTAEQIEASTRMMGFPAGTTKWDKYVAFNAFYSDLCTVYNDEQIIKGAHKFYFEDQDWGDTTKIWDYVYCKNAMVWFFVTDGLGLSKTEPSVFDKHYDSSFSRISFRSRKEPAIL